MKPPTFYLGIDVSKSKLHVGNSKKFMREFANNTAGHQQLIKYVDPFDHVHIVMESSGGYETLVCDALQDAGLAVSIVQASCVRSYAKSLKVLAKTDKLDARMIAEYAEASKPQETPKTPENQRNMRALRDRREQVIADRVREQNRLETCRDAQVRTMIQRHVEQLQAMEKSLSNELRRLMKTDKQFCRKHDVLMKQVGVGEVTTVTLLSHLPELGHCSRQQITSLAGIAPHPQDSGNYRGKRRIFGGRAAVRRALYMAARTAARHCPVLGEFYLRLRNAGKPFKVAIIAVARKLLIRLNTLIKEIQKENQQMKYT